MALCGILRYSVKEALKLLSEKLPKRDGILAVRGSFWKARLLSGGMPCSY